MRVRIVVCMVFIHFYIIILSTQFDWEIFNSFPTWTDPLACPARESKNKDSQLCLLSSFVFPLVLIAAILLA